ncbi:MAG: multidrug transporter [Lachnospiraceae bacterium]
MQEKNFTEKDWKLFRNKIPDWQETYMDRLNKEYIKLLSEDINASDKFWQLEKRIKQDRKRTGVQLEMSRSNLMFNIISLINEGAISIEDLEEFSEQLRGTVRFIVER